MAADDLGRIASVSPEAAGKSGSASLDWLLELLQQAMTEVMSGESTPLQKANAVARLGSLYLKASGTAELEKENRELTGKIAELEQRLDTLQTAPERTSSGSEKAENDPKTESRPRFRPRPLRGLSRAIRRTPRPEPRSSSGPPPPDANLALNESDEIQITVPPGTDSGDASP